MSRFNVNMSISQFQELKLRHSKYSFMLDELVEYAGPKAIIDMEKVPDDLPVTLSDELWSIALRWVNKKAFSSYYTQLREIVDLPFSNCRTVLEIGPGLGVFRSLISNLPYKLTTVDISMDSEPDIVCDITRSAIKAKSFDTVVAFQVLEHLPYEEFQNAIKTLSSIARKYVFISIPCRNHYLTIKLKSSVIRRLMKTSKDELNLSFSINRSLKDIDEQEMKRRMDRQNPHYWEAGRKSYSIQRILRDIESMNVKILRDFHNPDHPYHYFILIQVTE